MTPHRTKPHTTFPSTTSHSRSSSTSLTSTSDNYFSKISIYLFIIFIYSFIFLYILIGIHSLFFMTSTRPHRHWSREALTCTSQGLTTCKCLRASNSQSFLPPLPHHHHHTIIATPSSPHHYHHTIITTLTSTHHHHHTPITSPPSTHQQVVRGEAERDIDVQDEAEEGSVEDR